MTESDIKPCPFCGGDGRADVDCVDVECQQCFARGPVTTGPNHDVNRDKAIRLWNAAPRAKGRCA